MDTNTQIGSLAESGSVTPWNASGITMLLMLQKAKSITETSTLFALWKLWLGQGTLRGTSRNLLFPLLPATLSATSGVPADPGDLWYPHPRADPPRLCHWASLLSP